MMKYLFFNSNKPKRFFCSIGDRKLIIIALIFLSLLATVIISLAVGSVDLSLEELWQALWHQGTEINQVILWQLRLSRVLATLTVGSAIRCQLLWALPSFW